METKTSLMARHLEHLYIVYSGSLRSAGVFPVVASLPPKISYFWRERSDNQIYVCTSQANTQGANWKKFRVGNWYES